MIDRRTFMLGLGTGIIIGALLFKLFEIGASSESNLQQISNELNSTEEIVQGTPAPTMTSPPDPHASTEASTPPGTKAPASSQATSGKKQAEAVAEAGDEEDSFMVRIEPGLKLEEGAEVLENSMAIDDAEAFTASMLAHGNRIRAGYFLFQKGLSVEEVMSIVTSTPLTDEEVQQYRLEHSKSVISE